MSPLAKRLSLDLDETFPEFVTTYERLVYSTALRLDGDAEGALDLAAEAFSRAYVALRGYTERRVSELKLRPWLLTIVLNCCRNEARTRSRRPRLVPLEEAGEPASLEESTERTIERRCEADQLSDLVARLPDREREAVVLRHVVGLDYAELAAVMSCPEGTAKSHVHRGIARLRSLLAAPGGSDATR